MNSTPHLRDIRVALVHYWLVRRRGGERVLECLADMFPQADIFTLVLDPNCLQPPLLGRRIYTSFLQRIPGVRSNYQKLMPLFPLALETFNLNQYDLVISSESGPAKGVITSTKTCHVCYCHSPMRYLWDMYFEYQQNAPGGCLGRICYALVSHYLRLWDQSASSRVDYFVANSQNVANRIWKTYRRSADVIYPPVAVDTYSTANVPGEFYLIVGQLLRYKRTDIAIQACNTLGRKLVVIGDGEERARLQRMAGPAVTIMGWQSEDVLRDHYRRCRALLFPGEEDFGLTPVEAQANGRPVIAFGRGGALESVHGYFVNDGSGIKNPTGIFFQEPSPDSLAAAILEFEKQEGRFVPSEIRTQVARFDTQRFRSEITNFLTAKLGEFFSGCERSQEYSPVVRRGVVNGA